MGMYGESMLTSATNTVCLLQKINGVPGMSLVSGESGCHITCVIKAKASVQNAAFYCIHNDGLPQHVCARCKRQFEGMERAEKDL